MKYIQYPVINHNGKEYLEKECLYVYKWVGLLYSRDWYHTVNKSTIPAGVLSHVWLFRDPMDCSPRGSPVHSISRARILEWVNISFSRESSQARDWTHISFTGRQTLSLGRLLTWSVKIAQLCLTLCDPVNCSPPGSSVHGILQARIMEWVAVPFSRGSPQPKDGPQVSRIAGGFLTIWATWEIKKTTKKEQFLCWCFCFPQGGKICGVVPKYQSSQAPSRKDFQGHRKANSSLDHSLH